MRICVQTKLNQRVVGTNGKGAPFPLGQQGWEKVSLGFCLQMKPAPKKIRLERCRERS